MHRTARLLAVFAVLVGLLAMHGVTGGHTAMGAQVMGPTAMTASTVQPAQPTASVHPAARQAGTEMDRPSQPGMTSVATLCLAIRHADRTPGLRGCVTQQDRGMTHGSGLFPRPVRAGGAPRPPDLVAGLCVSRT